MPLDRAVRSGGVAPTGPRDVRPPLVVVVEGYRSLGRREDDRAGNEVLGRRFWEILGAGGRLGHGHIAGRCHERGELVVGDLGGVHPEPVDMDTVHRPAVGHRIVAAERFATRVVASHRELAAGDPHHSPGRLGRRGCWAGAGRLEAPSLGSARAGGIPSGEEHDSSEHGRRSEAEKERPGHVTRNGGSCRHGRISGETAAGRGVPAPPHHRSFPRVWHTVPRRGSAAGPAPG